MKNLLGILVIFSALAFLLVVAKDECEELKEKELSMKCDFTDFEEYRKCVKERKEIRRKRAIICPITGKVVDIDKLSGRSDTPAAPLVSDGEQPILVPIVAAAQQSDQPIQANPAPIFVESNPSDINHNWIVEGEDSNYVHTQRYHPARNVTTVIKLTNLINNTNVINVPTHINSTNINNITIVPSELTQDYGFGHTKDGPCCMVVQPKTCHSSPNGPRCHHKRHKMCSSKCTSRILHVRSHRSHGVSYIPQPSPKCIYSQSWPYVNCGYRRRDSCDGCYEHYDNYYYAPPPSCNGCYDDGMEYGPMYRRGPVLRPNYYHQPPPYFETGYAPYPEFDGYNYGTPNYYIDPPSQYEPNAQVFEDDYSLENGTLSNESKDEADWGISVGKCKVISNDGSVTIANCTIEKDHPYAAAPADYEYSKYPPPREFYPPPPPFYTPYLPGYYPPPYYYNRPPPPRGYARNSPKPSNHKIAPLTSRKSSSETVARPLEDEEISKTFPEDDIDEEETNFINDDEK
uniref:CSON006206 protein n=1 Tax=Culicoides sonorensis TaxID=179676 RepID=A0A336MS24_CULSO